MNNEDTNKNYTTIETDRFTPNTQSKTKINLVNKDISLKIDLDLLIHS